MTHVNDKGMVLFDVSDTLNPLASNLNAMTTSISDFLDSRILISVVANIPERTARVLEVGVTNISASNPLYVYRVNANAGYYIEKTIDGTTWTTLPESFATEDWTLLSGDMSGMAFWNSLRTGNYRVWNTSTAGVPNVYGFIQVFRYNNDGTAVFYNQAGGRTYRFTWNNSTTSVVWSEEIRVRGDIPTALDFNSIDENCDIMFNSNANMANMTNAPVALAGMLTTRIRPRQNPSESIFNFRYQTYTVYNAGAQHLNGATFARQYYNGSWNAWTIVGGNDTGWINLTYKSGYTNTTAGQLKYRRIGNRVEIRGGATGTYTNGGVHTIATLPAAVCPAEIIRSGAAATGGRNGRWEITAEGNINMTWYSSTDTAPTWMSLQTSFELG